MSHEKRELAIYEAAAKLSLETVASPKYALEFCLSFAQALERAASKPLTGRELRGGFCSHDPYEGKCIHCGVPFFEGRPKYPEDDDDRAAAEEALAEFKAKGGVPIGQIEADIAIDTATAFADQYRTGAQGAQMDCDNAQILAAAIDHLLANQKAKGFSISEWIDKTINETRAKLDMEPLPRSPLAEDILGIVKEIENFRKGTSTKTSAGAGYKDDESKLVSKKWKPLGSSMTSGEDTAYRKPASFPPVGYVLVPEEPTKAQIDLLSRAMRVSVWNGEHVIKAYKDLIAIDGITHQEPAKQQAVSDFKPCVLISEELGTTTIYFDDCAYIAEPIFEGVYHWMDKHVSMRDGSIVGATIWMTTPKEKVAERKLEDG